MSVTAPRHRRWMTTACIALMSLIPAWTLGLWWAASDPVRLEWVFRVTVGVLLVVLFFGVRAIIRFIQAHEHLTRGFCRTCGYDLTGLQESRCPECKTTF